MMLIGILCDVLADSKQNFNVVKIESQVNLASIRAVAYHVKQNKPSMLGIINNFLFNRMYFVMETAQQNKTDEQLMTTIYL